MNPKQLFIAVPAVIFVLGSDVANAGKTLEEAGAFACAQVERLRRLMSALGHEQTSTSSPYDVR
jgi:hypothetical protein